jgi:hypothetical protein
MRRSTVWVLLITAAPFIIVAAVASRGTARLSPEEIDVCEAVFRHQFESHKRAEEWAVAYHLEVYGRRPPAELLERFAGNRPVVMRRPWFVPDESLQFDITEIIPVGNGVVEVTATEGFSGRTTSLTHYTVVNRSGKWTVGGVRGVWIE